MKVNIGFIKSESQFLLKELGADSQVESRTLDTIEIKECPLNLLFFPEQTPPEGLTKTLSEEEKFYPILSAASFGLEAETFDSLDAQELADLFAKVNSRWILNNNIKTIEQIYSVISYLRDLWQSDRSAFFEELWFILKTNLASTELTAVFHDVKDIGGDKGEKPVLAYSYVTGEKTPQIFEGKEKEESLMKEYASEFGEHFEITEFDSNKGQLVATVKIGLSPILIMAKLSTFNQLQRSILIALFSGIAQDQ